MDKKILVIGDIMLDLYYNCDVNRISPEAPIPVLKYNHTKQVLGGAANVANNLALNGQEVDLLGIIGDDPDGEALINLMESAGILPRFVLYDSERPTTCKTRFISKGQQIFRFDREKTQNISPQLEDSFRSLIKENISQYDLVIISDYLKGLVTFDLARYTIALCNENKIPVIVDPKDANLQKYKDCALMKPNRKELEALVGEGVIDDENILAKAMELKEKLNCDYLLVTLGSKGMIFMDDRAEPMKIESEAQEIYDVTGAGDTVLAYLAMGFQGSTIDLEAVKLANSAAGIKVGKFGTAVVKKEELAVDEFHYTKTVSADNVGKLAQKLREKKKTIVFTNGCFDILHSGHIQYLQQAKKLGDVLILGLNSDSSIRRLKGDQRPILNEDERTTLIGALQSVDYVVLFDEDTPLELLEKVRPDILVKGGDYIKENIVGHDLVTSYGGQVITLPFIEGKSTTNIISKIMNLK
jgi:D-beta-D-heptose 7-phosphate kinase/D-beta-D-heptose 1-phosphate adenosyltransferase